MSHRHTYCILTSQPTLGSHTKFTTAVMQFPVGRPWLHQQPPVPLSSVLHTPPQARTHSLTRTPLPSQPWREPSGRAQSHPQPRDSSPEKENAAACERASLLRWGSSILPALFSSAGALVVCRIWQVDFHRIRWGTSSIVLFFTRGVVLTWRLKRLRASGAWF